MKLSLLILLTALAGTGNFSATSASAQVAPDGAYVLLDPADLQSLAAPVALYPDAMLAQILVACTYPNDVIAAAQYLDAGGDPNAIDNQGWDLSVAGVARYPALLHYMASNGDWMNSLGAAFVNQQADVMNAVQVLRSEAMAAGNLVSNAQQQVIVDGGIIEIVPTDPNNIYPPIYDPTLVYQPEVVVPGTAYAPLIQFWNPIPCGIWLHHDLDWHDHRVYVGSWGSNRPWWKHDQHGGEFDYTHDRPGLYATNQNITVNVHNQVVNVKGGAWSRQAYDPQKPMPKLVVRPGGRLPNARPGTGYEPGNRPAGGSGGIANYDHAPTVAQQDQRGRASLEKGGIRPATPAARPSEPAHPRSPANPPARRAVPAPTFHAAPAPTPHAEPVRQTPAPQRSAPVERRAPVERGAAVGGYNNGAQTSHESSRGASSRGSSGGARR